MSRIRPEYEIENDITHGHDGPVTRFVAIARACNCVRHKDDPQAVAGVLYRLLFGEMDDALLDGTPVRRDLNSSD